MNFGCRMISPSGRPPLIFACATGGARNCRMTSMAISARQPWARKLVQAYQSEEVRKFIETEFKGSLVPAF